MASNQVRVSQLIDSHAPFAWQESLALVRAIAAVRTDSPGVRASGTFDEFVIQENGDVTAVGSAPPLSVSELALLLARLLPPPPRHAPIDAADTRPAERPPAGLYFTIARALAMVDAPSFATAQEFAAALARYERARPTVVLRQLFARHNAAASTSSLTEPGSTHETAKAAVEAGPSEEGSTLVQSAIEARSASVGMPDRRRSRMPSDVLRRMLREEDRRNFLEMQERAESAKDLKRPRQTGPDAQLLRRFIREADERTYALMQETARARISKPRPPSRRAGYHAAFAVMALLVAAVVYGLAAWQPPRAPVAHVRTLGPTSTPPPSAAPATPGPATSSSDDGEPVASTPAAEPVSAPATEHQGPRVQRPTARPTSGSRQGAAPQAARPAKTPNVVAVADPSLAKRRNTVPRFFASIYRKLGSLVRRGDSGQPAMTE